MRKIFLVLIVLLIAIAAYFFVFNTKSSSDVKIEAGWLQSSTGKGMSFYYPEKLPTSYVSTVDWPPQVQIFDQPFSCTETSGEVNPAEGKTVERKIANIPFCVTEVTGAAAGSMYTHYAYATEKDGRLAVLTFTLRFVQCGNYDEPQKNACEAERSSFSVDAIAGRIATTLQIIK